MGSGGTEWDANDNPEKARLNQKTVYVGTGAGINGLATTYAGQLAYCTSTGSGFTVDNLYVRNAANSSWVNISQFSTLLTETVEANTTPITDNADFTCAAGTRYYMYFTLPSTEKNYIITGLEWKNGATVNGNIICGVDSVNANPPTLDHTPLLALSIETAASGASSIQRSSLIASSLIRAGTICGAWVASSSGTHTLREKNNDTSVKHKKICTYSTECQTPTAANNTAFSGADAFQKYLKVYYVGYK